MADGATQVIPEYEAKYQARLLENLREQYQQNIAGEDQSATGAFKAMHALNGIKSVLKKHGFELSALDAAGQKSNEDIQNEINARLAPIEDVRQQELAKARANFEAFLNSDGKPFRPSPEEVARIEAIPDRGEREQARAAAAVQEKESHGGRLSFGARTLQDDPAQSFQTHYDKAVDAVRHYGFELSDLMPGKTNEQVTATIVSKFESLGKLDELANLNDEPSFSAMARRSTAVAAKG